MIKFKAKIRTIRWADGGDIAYECIDVPKLSARHCDMAAFRANPKYSAYANSDLFGSVLSNIRDRLGRRVRLDSVPDGVSVDTSGFLAEVTIGREFIE